MADRRERIVERIRGVLNIARDTTYEHEAAAALLLAQRLLVKHGLTLAEVEDGGETGTQAEDVADAAVGEPSGRLPWWHRLLASIVAENFRCSAYVHRTRRQATVCLIGLATDVAVAREVYRFGLKTLAEAARRHAEQQKLAPPLARRVRNDFIYGFLCGLRDKFAEQVAANRWALALQPDPRVEQEVAQRRMRRATAARPGLSGDGRARAAGYQRGQEFGESVRPRPGRLEEAAGAAGNPAGRMRGQAR
ncbi:MAG: DUF2786 domain-containing protein [Chitinophagales bacterium]